MFWGSGLAVLLSPYGLKRKVHIAIVLATLCALQANAQTCTVFGVTDGDTIKVRCGHNQAAIRLGGIDAPEKNQPFGQRSKHALSDLCYLQEAQIIPKTTDRYGRTIADVQCRGKDAGTEQVKAGMAWVYDRYSKGYEPLYRAQNAARAERTGLWIDPDPEPPWQWRRK